MHDVYTNRILQVLSSMQKITLYSLPEDEPWTVEEFLANTELHCQSTALELNRRSLMVEEAVEEVLELVKKAGESFKGDDFNFDFNFEGMKVTKPSLVSF